MQETLEKGTSFGAPSVHENTLAKKVIEAVPSVEMVRFTNSGTEVINKVTLDLIFVLISLNLVSMGLSHVTSGFFAPLVVFCMYISSS